MSFSRASVSSTHDKWRNHFSMLMSKSRNEERIKIFFFSSTENEILNLLQLNEQAHELTQQKNKRSGLNDFSMCCVLCSRMLHGIGGEKERKEREKF